MSLESDDVQIQNNNFTGNGSMELFSPESSDIVLAANFFDGVRMHLNDVSNSKVRFRNNEGIDVQLDEGFPIQCDVTGTGQEAGCDRRAACQPKDPRSPAHGVQCECLPPLSFSEGTRDGSRCSLVGEVLDIFQETRVVQAVVRKPKDLQLPFFIRAMSKESFEANISTSQPFLLIKGTHHSKQRYLMSSAKSEQKIRFKLTVAGNQLDWPDTSEPERACVEVRSPNGIAAANGAQTLSVDVILRPYASCKHTDVEVEGSDMIIDHLSASERFHLLMVARDSDGHRIIKTPVDFHAQVLYENAKVSPSTLTVTPKYWPNGSRYGFRAAVPSGHVWRAGKYKLQVELQKAWNDTHVQQALQT